MGQVRILADADDSLVYLKDTNDLYQLQQAIHTYIKAFNYILNYHKTTAISLSGKFMLEWQALLGSHSSPNGMIVLPLLHSFISATHFVLVLLSAMLPFEKFTILSVIPLTFIPNVMYPRGRVAILNSLICSKLGHVLRLSVFTEAQLLSLRSLGTFFINARIFPKFSFDTLIQPRKYGGLGLLYPLKQQQDLRWRWVCPIYLSYIESRLLKKYKGPSLQVLEYILL